MVKQEWKRLLKNPLLILVLTAIILIPSIYAGFFLESMWDPYGELDKLPVAVVNLDKPVDFNGKELNIGSDLVDNLATDGSMDFTFTDADTAHTGLVNGDYYMVITIPEDFSRNATTLTENKPETMMLSYETNPATNYVAMKLSESAMTKIELSLQQKVTETYAEEFYDRLQDISTQLNDASDGTSEIITGENKLSDGANDLSTGTQTLYEGTVTLNDGSSKLASGTSELKNGLDSYLKGTEDINSGALALENGASALKNGTDSLYTGATDLKSGTSSLSSGAAQVNDGAKQVSEGTKSAADAMSKVDQGATTLASGSKNLSDGMNTINTGADKLSQGASTLDAGAQKVATGAADLNNGLVGLQSAIPGLTNGLSQLETGSSTLNDGIIAYTGGVDTACASSAQLAAGSSALNDKINGEGGLCASSAAFNTSLSGLATQVQGLAEAGIVPSDLADGLNALAYNYSLMDSAINGESGLGNSVTTLNNGVQALNTGLVTIAGEDNSNSQNLRDGSASVLGGLKTINSSASTLSDGVDKLVTGSSDLKTGTADLSKGASELSKGAGDLYAGTQNAAKGASDLSSGAKTLSEGTTALNQGMSTLNEGAATLYSGTTDLSSGAAALDNGASSLVSGADKIRSGASDLSTGTKTLHNGTAELTSNNEAISNGIASVDQGAADLSSGAQKLVDGSSQVNDGAGLIAESMPELITGTGTLKDGLSDGAKKISDTPSTTFNISMFANPVDTTENKLTDVKDNGHAMAAYMMSVGLWVASLAFCLMYPLTKHDGIESGFKWWLSKASVLYPMAVLQAILLVVILHKALGFAPVNMGQTIFVACLASIAFMSIMYFFNVLLGKVGSFIMLIFMVLQLAGSAGTYPIEISGKFAQALNKFMPFTYTVAAFRSTIGGGASYKTAIAVLVSIFAISTTLTIILFMIRGKEAEQGRKNLYEVMEEHGFA